MNYTTKEPISCKAIQWNGDNLEEIEQFIKDSECNEVVHEDNGKLVVSVYLGDAGWLHLSKMSWLVIFKGYGLDIPAKYSNNEFKAKFKPI